MDYEKAYKEALERAKEYYDVDEDNTMQVHARGVMEYIFPELAESEDEKIRLMLLDMIKRWLRCAEENNVTNDIKQAKAAIAWLEKLGKQIDDKDNKLDNTHYEDIFWCIKKATENAKDENEMGTCWYAERLLKRLIQKSLKRIWTKDDDLIYQHCLNILHDYAYDEWLKEFKSQYNIVNTEDLKEAEKDAYNNALDKIEYSSDEPTFHDGWMAAVNFIKGTQQTI